MIHLQNIYKFFDCPEGGTFGVLRDLSLKVNSGEIFGLIGRSGAGKSTVLRMIPLLERPDQGKVIVQGRDLAMLSPAELRRARQKLGFVFQQFNLMSNRTVAGNVAFPLEIAGLPREEIAIRVAECLDIVNLSDRANHYPSQLSGGQKQRVGIARALAPQPTLILADEPTSSLDPHAGEAVLTCLRDINQRFGVTIVIVTHEMKVVRSTCHRVALIDQGRVFEVLDFIGDQGTQSELARSLLEAA